MYIFHSHVIANSDEIWNKNVPSREADLNHRPKDHWIIIQLQSSALPAELSRVGWISGV